MINYNVSHLLLFRFPKEARLDTNRASFGMRKTPKRNAIGRLLENG